MTRSNHQEVLDFHLKFGLPSAPNDPHFLPRDLLMFRIKFMVEELQEFMNANGLTFNLELVPTKALENPEGDMVEAADALIDLAYVVHGTAVMMGLPWQALWDEVHQANMKKTRVKREEDSKRGSAYDVVKPQGWQAPNHLPILGEGPFPTLGGKP